MSDLDRLIEAVEGGTKYGVLPLATACYPRDRDGRMLPDTGGWSDAHVVDAYRGSIDAALSLKEALLPGWEWVVGSNGDDSRAVVGGEGKEHAQADHRNPARALLLAVLKAYRETRG